MMSLWAIAAVLLGTLRLITSFYTKLPSLVKSTWRNCKVCMSLDQGTLSDVADQVNNSVSGPYVPPEVSTEIWIGSIVAVLPIIWATVEFTSRIRTQQRCLVCTGSGLVYVTKKGNQLKRPIKCWNCGGFLPWLGWKMFFLSTFFDVGNGGVLQRPAADYAETNKKFESMKNSAKDGDKGESKEI